MEKRALDLFADLSRDAKQRARAKADAIVLSSRLAELRKEAGLTQSELAARLDVQQAAVSRMEHRADIKVSYLLRYLEALGGRNIRLLADIQGKRQRIPLAP